MPGSNPFRGLKPYQRDDAGSLFGRDGDLILVRDRVFSARTTLMFAPSGVGKTSFLNASLIPALEKRCAVCYYNLWSVESPLEALKTSLAAGLAVGDAPARGSSLLELVEASRDRQVVLILDQFEELFQYHAYHDHFLQFRDELSEVINRAERARLFLAMREEFLGELSVFDNSIPDLFGNYYRLKFPNLDEARDIIVKTATLASDRLPLCRGEDEGLELLLDDLTELDPELTGSLPGSAAKPGKSLHRDYVEPPFLQLICQRLWEGDVAEKRARFLGGYKKGEAREIVDRYCGEELSPLTRFQQELLARAFEYLITKRGAKMAYELESLASHMKVGTAKLAAVLGKLSDPEVRILRESRRPDGTRWFELYHDMYAPVLYRWKERKRESLRRLLMRAAVVVAAVAGLAFLYWYFFQLPKPYVESLSTASEDVEVANVAHRRLKDIPIVGRRADRLLADFWQRRAMRAGVRGDRDEALVMALKALEVDPTDRRRREAADLIGQDYLDLQLTLRHPDAVAQVTFCADGRTIATLTETLEAHRWDAATGGHRGSVRIPNVGGRRFRGRRAALSPDCRFVATPESDGRAIVWQLATGRLQALPRHEDEEVAALSFGMDGKRLVTAGSKSARLWDPATGGFSGTALEFSGTAPEFLGSDEIDFIALSPAADAIVTTSDSGVILRPFRTEGASWRLGSGSGPVAFSPDGAMVAVGGVDARVLDAATGEVIFELALTEPVESLAFAPDGKTVAAANRSLVHLWDTSTGTLVGAVRSAGRPIAVALGPENAIATTSADGVVRISRGLPKPHSGWGLQLADRAEDGLFNPDASLFAASDGAVIRVWDAVRGSLRHSFDLGEPATGFDFVEDGNVLAATTSERLACWELTGGESVARCSRPVVAGLLDLNPFSERSLNEVMIDPQIRRLASRSGDNVLVWEIGRGGLAKTFTSDKSWVPVGFSPDGRLLATAGPAGVAVHDVVSGDTLAEFERESGWAPAAAFTQDAGSIAALFEEGLWVWDTKGGPPSRFLEAGYETQNNSSLGFGPDETTLVASRLSWLLQFSLEEDRVRPIAVRPLPGLIVDAAPLAAPGKARVAIVTSSGSLAVATVDLTAPRSPPVEGSPEALLEPWQERLALTLEADGSVQDDLPPSVAEPTGPGRWSVILASYKDVDLARRRVASLQESLPYEEVQLWYAVNDYFAPSLGPFESEEAARAKAAEVESVVPDAYPWRLRDFPAEVAIDPGGRNGR